MAVGADVNLRQAKENIAPSVSASASQGFNFGNYEKSVGWNGNYGINAGMTLFNGLSNANKIKQSQLNVEQSKLYVESSTNSVRISVIQAFLSIMMNEEILGYQQQVLTASQEQMEPGKQQLDVGQILESDYKMLQAQYTSDLYNIENTRHTIKSNYLTLKNLLSIDPSIQITIVPPPQPVYKVDVGTQVSGIVEHIYVDFNSVVKKGQLLAELDRSNLNEQLKTAQASVSNAQSNLTLAQQQFDRIKALYNNKAATLEAYESAVNTLTLAKNQLKTAQSELSRAQTNLSYATIYSPIDGVVMDKAVEEGQIHPAEYFGMFGHTLRR